MRAVPALTDAEIEVLRRGRSDPNIILNYFFRPFGASKGFLLDDNFDEIGAWQKMFATMSQRNGIVSGGFGCADIDSLVYDADFHRYISFRWMIRSGYSPTILAKTEDGWKKVKALGPFLVGRSAFYRVETQSGKVVSVSGDHRFLTTRGYVRTLDLRAGDLLIAPDNLPATVQNGNASDSCDQEITSSFQDRCSYRSHRYGELPLPWLAGDQSSFPSQDDVRKPIHLPCKCLDTHLGQEQPHRRRYENTTHPQKRDSIHRKANPVLRELQLHESEANDVPVRPASATQVLRQSWYSSNQYWQDVLGLDRTDPERMTDPPSEVEAEFEFRAYPSPYKTCLPQPQATLPHLGLILPCLPKIEAIPAYIDSNSDDASFIPQINSNSKWWNHTTLDTVSLVIPIGERDAYDLHVPEHQNYVMEGLVHHNTGKTLTVGMAACWLSLITHPDFKFLGVAPTALQSQWMYDLILKQAEGAPFQRLIWSSPAKPYPKIEIKFKVNNVLVTSSLFFMSVDKNARNILTFEGDWINIDEAGLIDNLEETIISLSSRLRGSFRGRERLGRLTLTSNPWINDYFWYLFDLSTGDPESYLSITASTKHNHNVTPDQLKQILDKIPPSEHERFINGARPEGRGNFFSRQAIYDCEDEGWGRLIEEMTEDEQPGYNYVRKSGCGAVFYTTPRKPNPPKDDMHSDQPIYIILGDPGTGSAPSRNAPAIGVFECTDFPHQRAELVALWWGNGEGSISPFVIQLAKFIEMYDPTFVGVDSTSTQKNFAETLNAMILQRDDEDYSTLFGLKFKIPHGLKVSGLDFSGAKKSAYLVAMQFVLEARLWRWPKNVVGLRGQLSNYDPEKDKTQSTSKVPQDLVAMMSMAAFVIRRWFNADPQDSLRTFQEGSILDGRSFIRNIRYDRDRRTRRARPTVPEAERIKER